MLWYQRPHESHWVPDCFCRSHYTRLAQCYLQVQGLAPILRSPINLLEPLHTGSLPELRFFLLSFRHDPPLTATKTSRPRHQPEPSNLPGSNPYPVLNSSLKTRLSTTRHYSDKYIKVYFNLRTKLGNFIAHNIIICIYIYIYMEHTIKSWRKGKYYIMDLWNKRFLLHKLWNKINKHYKIWN